MTVISVIVPVLNDGEHLRRCLAALNAQARVPDEVIVVDNGSSDGSAGIARAAGARVVTEPVRGIPAATAAGFDSAVGELLARLDADSIPPADWLERVEAHLTEGQAEVVTGPGEFYDAGPATRWFGRWLYVGTYFRSMRVVLGHPPVFGSNFAMRAEIWAAARQGVHRTIRTVHDDLDLSIQFHPGTAIVYDPDLVVGISPRPLTSVGGFARRAWWVVLTLLRNNREESLLHRRARWRREHRVRR